MATPLLATTSKGWLLFLGVFALVGLVLLAIGYSFWRSNQALKTKGIQATGIVIDHIQGWKNQRERSTAVAVVVQYVDWQNQPRIYRSETFTTPALFDVGEKVQLWYMKDKPDTVLLEGKSEWLLPAILGGMGLIFSLIGLPGLIKELIRSLFY